VYPELSAALNLDMVGRLRNAVTMQSVAASPRWPGLIEEKTLKHGLNVVTQADPYLPTDSTSFYMQGVPTLNAFTGSHDDYHTTNDTFEKLNYDGMRRIALVMGDVLIDVARDSGAPPFNRVKDPNNGGGGTGGGFKAYLGTVPDYGNTVVKGVLLSGVKADSPAERAGIKGGDIIVSLAGQKIENIYDYTAVLGVLKIGEAVEIKILRGAEELTFLVTPAPRG
jgi:membrane-associated protease RseP (regulator of RpoE activity)